MVLVVFIAGMSFSGCAGQYALFNKAHPFIGNLGGKWIGAVVNWIIGLPIVYPICIFADAFIFNVIEFWTGKNIIASGNSFEQIDENGNRLAAVKNDDGTLSVSVTETTGETTVYLLDREGNDFSMFDANGVLLSSYTVAYEEISK
jgi:hypothetical protein